MFKKPGGTEEMKLVLSSVSRALWFNNLNLARKLIDYSVFAKDLIFIEDAQVKAHSFERFEVIFGDVFNVYHSSQVRTSAADCNDLIDYAEEAAEIAIAVCQEDESGIWENRQQA